MLCVSVTTQKHIHEEYNYIHIRTHTHNPHRHARTPRSFAPKRERCGRTNLERRISPCNEFSVSPVVWMLSATCCALLRQRFIAALMLLIMIFILALLKLLACRKEKVPLEENFCVTRPSCASNSFLWHPEPIHLVYLSFLFLTKHVTCMTLRQLPARVASPVPSCVYGGSEHTFTVTSSGLGIVLAPLYRCIQFIC